MTICKILAEKTVGDKTVTAYENYDKFSNVPYYEIVVSQDSFAVEVIKTAKTTWKKRFRKI